jgi:hypothetical protein
MKKTLIFSTVMIFMAGAAIAQKSRIAISGGVDAARMAISGASGGPLNYRTEAVGGIGFEHAISSTFGLQIEANYSAQGAGVINDDATTAGAYKLDYVTFPVLAKLYANKNLSFLVGPQVGVAISSKVKSSGDPDQDVKDQLKTTDFYAVFGSEYRFANGVFLGARYNVGVVNQVKDESSNTDIKNRYFSFRIGYSFALGGSNKKTGSNQ